MKKFRNSHIGNDFRKHRKGSMQPSSHVVYIDCSSSISPETIQAFYAEIQEILAQPSVRHMRIKV